jgi:hypothetical protein
MIVLLHFRQLPKTNNKCIIHEPIALSRTIMKCIFLVSRTSRSKNFGKYFPKLFSAQILINLSRLYTKKILEKIFRNFLGEKRNLGSGKRDYHILVGVNVGLIMGLKFRYLPAQPTHIT